MFYRTFRHLDATTRSGRYGCKSSPISMQEQSAMGSETRAITDRVTKQIVTIFSKTCNNNICFQKCHYVTFLVKKWNVSDQNTRLQFYHLIIPCIGHSKSHFLPLVLDGKSVDFLVSEFFLHCDLSVRIFSSKGTGFGFPPV